jgi:molybdopterin/thiamine biosynthesis adenylyltransferase
MQIPENAPIRMALSPSQAPRQALILSGSNMLERAVLHNLREQSPTIHIVDVFQSQLREWLKAEHPEKSLSEEELNHLAALHSDPTDDEKNGVWVYYPWRNALVHCLSKDEFIRVRTIRNLHKITGKEQDHLANARVGIVGLSVGQSVAISLVMERICGSLRIADFDTLELSNLNRIRSSMIHQGELKTTIVAREIAEIDPFIEVSCYDKGLQADNIYEFLEGLDIVVDECDSLEMKIMLRKACREKGIAVVMDTSDSLMLDIERFDLEPNRPIFHGLLDEETPIDWSDPKQRMHALSQIIEPQKASIRAQQSLTEIGKTITTWPQLATDVAMGGAFAAKLVRQILLGDAIPSGRFRTDIIGQFQTNATFQSIAQVKHV